MLAIIAVAPLLADRIRVLEANRADQLAAARVRVLDLARNAVNKQDEVLATVQAALLTVGHAVDRLPATPGECNRLLADIASDLPSVRSLFAAGTSGLVSCASKLTAVGIDITDRPYFQAALRDGGFVHSGLIYPRNGGEPAIVAAYSPAGAADRPAAVLGAVVDLQWDSQFVALVGQRPRSLALLVKSDGTVLAGQPTPTGWVGRDIGHDPLIRLVQARGEGVTTAAAFDGNRRLWGFLPVPHGDAHVLVGIDEQEIVSGIERELIFSYVQLAFVVLLVLLGAWAFGAHAILRPIQAFARHAERIGRGDLTVRAGREHWASEFRPLTRALDSMAARLALRENSLRSESDRLRELATLDALTELSNRRAFDTHLLEAWAQAQETGDPVALLMVDVDHFKRYNDHYGHPVGDACLRTLARILSAAAVADSRAARYGGEEFAVLLPGASIAEATFVAQNIRRTVEDLGIEHVGTPYGVVTVSIGVASLVPVESSRVETLIAAADAALYASKHGRNTVTSCGPSSTPAPLAKAS